MRDENVGHKVGRIDPADQGSDPVFEIRLDQVIAERRRLACRMASTSRTTVRT
jgi:hypothetical protein